MATQGSVRPKRRTKVTPAKITRPRNQPVEAEWLSLRQASDLLGVHPATLRAWANQGRVASQRTVGGHRRFRRSELEQRTRSQREPSASVEMLIHGALGRVRLTIEQSDMPWLDRIDAADRAQHRDLGRRLLIDLAASLEPSADRAASLLKAQALGHDYAALSRQHSLSLTESVQAFLFFRDSMVDSLIQLAGLLEASTSASWQLAHRHLIEFTNAVLLGLIESYQKLKAKS